MTKYYCIDCIELDIQEDNTWLCEPKGRKIWGVAICPKEKNDEKIKN